MNNMKPIDISAKNLAKNTAERKRQILQQMKQEALEALQAKKEISDQMEEDMLKTIDLPDNITINSFGEVERSGKSR